MSNLCYRKLRGYKYQLSEKHICHTNIKKFDINTKFICLDPSGILTIKEYYAWDGPSGPTIDTHNFMRGSLVHDALYQLIRMKELPHNLRKQADILLRTICKEDGMSSIRSRYVYWAVRMFGGKSAKPGDIRAPEPICIKMRAEG